MNETNDYFIRKTLQKYLIPTIFSILGTTMVGFINTILAGQFLGKEALTAMNLLSSFTFLFAMLGCMISIGASARASIAMGMGDENAVGEYEMYAFLMSFLFPALFSVVILLCFRPFLFMMGADESLYLFMKDYAKVVLAFGFLTTLMYFPFNFLRLDGRANLAMLVFGIMGVLDVVLLVLFLRAGAGLPGVAWAMVISTAVADLLGILFLFFGKNRQIRPVFPGVKKMLSLTGSVCRVGAASGLNNLCNMLRTLVLNALILHGLGTEAASEFAIACALISFASASVYGCGQTVAPLIGVFYGERDPVSMKILMKRTIRYSAVIHGILFLLMIPLAGTLAHAFGMTNPRMISEAAEAVRLAALSLIPAAIMNVFIYYYTAVGENRIALVLTFFRSFGFVVLFAAILFAAGLGRWYMVSFAAGEVVSFGCMMLLCAGRRKRQPEKKGLLLIDESKNEGEVLLSFSVSGDKDGAVDASEKMAHFCDENEMEPRLSMMLPLALEELLVVLGEHCLAEDKNRYADVRIMIHKDGVLLRIRCGGVLFDPMEWYHKRKESMSKEELLADDTLGIRMIDEKAKSIMFKRTLGVNNLIVEF